MKNIFYIVFCTFLFSKQIFAQNIEALNTRYQTFTQGDVLVIGNNILNRQTKKWNANTENNNQKQEIRINDGASMEYIDIDKDSKTFSSSSATLLLPYGKKTNILFAGLYWVATYPYERGILQNKSFLAENEERNEIEEVLLKLPKEDYISVKGEVIFDGSTDVHYVANAPYVVFADVTTLLQNSKRKDGEYTVANVRAGKGYIEGGSSAGWALVVVYEDFKEKMKKIDIKDGFLEVKSTGIPIVFNKFKTPAEQEVFPRLFGATLECDAYLGENKIAVRTRKSGVYLETDTRKAENFFNSSITEDEGYLKGRKLNSINTMGFDIFSMEVPNFNNQFVPSESETLNIDIVSTEDVFYAFLMGLSIDSDVLTSTEQVQKVFDEEQKKLEEQSTKISDAPLDTPQEKKVESTENKSVEEEKKQETPQKEDAKKGYYTILGAYSTKENAEKYLKNIHKKGIEAQGIFFHPTKNKYYVYFTFTTSYNDALKAQKDFTKLKSAKPDLKDFKDVWILVME
ncbi:MAG: SPOR domain-containing protein [Capnocytophaga sp.]|nr:SPOR domain-containing protein [Capnocytophaga sp.]